MQVVQQQQQRIMDITTIINKVLAKNRYAIKIVLIKKPPDVVFLYLMAGSNLNFIIKINRHDNVDHFSFLNNDSQL
jgi:hypothetical protein